MEIYESTPVMQKVKAIKEIKKRKIWKYSKLNSLATIKSHESKIDVFDRPIDSLSHQTRRKKLRWIDL